MSRELGQKSPRTRCIGLRAKVWWIIRNRKRGTIEDLLRTLAEGSEKEAYGNVRQYLKGLTLVGILQVDQERQPDGKPTSNGLKVYRLVKDVGHKAPVLKRGGKSVLDPNSGEVLPPLAETTTDPVQQGEKIKSIGGAQ